MPGAIFPKLLNECCSDLRCDTLIRIIMCKIITTVYGLFYEDCHIVLQIPNVNGKYTISIFVFAEKGFYVTLAGFDCGAGSHGIELICCYLIFSMICYSFSVHRMITTQQKIYHRLATFDLNASSVLPKFSYNFAACQIAVFVDDVSVI